MKIEIKLRNIDSLNQSKIQTINDLIKNGHEVYFKSFSKKGGKRFANSIKKQLDSKEVLYTEVISDPVDSDIVVDEKSLPNYNWQFLINDYVNKCVLRPWGRYDILHVGINTKVKRIEVNPKGALSYQSHKHRAEVWVVTEGSGEFKLNEKKYKVGPGSVLKINPGEKHKIVNDSEAKLVFIETQLGTCDEEDIERFEDIYGRVK